MRRLGTVLHQHPRDPEPTRAQTRRSLLGIFSVSGAQCELDGGHYSVVSVVYEAILDKGSVDIRTMLQEEVDHVGVSGDAGDG